MDTHYGISVNNKFDLFLDDEELDPLDILRQQEEAKEKKKDKKKDPKQKDTKSTKNKKNKTVLSQDQSNKIKISDDKENRRGDEKPLGQKPSKQIEYNENRDDRMKKLQKDNRERDLPPRRRENRDFTEKSGNFGSSSPQSEFRDRPESVRGRGRNFRGRVGPRGRGGFDRFGKREFDRHSGSDKTGFKGGEKRDGSGPHNWGNWTDDMKEEKKGVKPTDKREGNGAYNWGTLQDDLEENIAANEDEQVEEVVVKEESVNEMDPVEKSDEADENSPKGVEEMTLDEWRAQQTQTRTKPEFNLRKAGEGCENTDWKKMFLLKKKPVDEENSDEDEYYETDEEEDGRKKKMVNIEIHFSESARRGGRGSRGRRGERGMGRGRGRSGREGFLRGGKHADPAPNVMDDQDFPSLH